MSADSNATTDPQQSENAARDASTSMRTERVSVRLPVSVSEALSCEAKRLGITKQELIVREVGAAVREVLRDALAARQWCKFHEVEYGTARPVSDSPPAAVVSPEVLTPEVAEPESVPQPSHPAQSAAAMLQAVTTQINDAVALLAAVEAPGVANEVDSPAPGSSANMIAYFEKVFEMIAGDKPGCECGYCASCLAKGALSGPNPGETWFWWEREKEVHRERLRQRHPGITGPPQ